MEIYRKKEKVTEEIELISLTGTDSNIFLLWNLIVSQNINIVTKIID